MKNNEYTINFWITSDVNPMWADPDSNGIFRQYENKYPYILFFKEGSTFRVEIKKNNSWVEVCSVNIESVIGKKTMITFVMNKNGKAKMYINGRPT